MKFLSLIIFLSLFLGRAQTTINGHIDDEKGNPVAFANVFLKDVYDGGSTDESGNFSFATMAKGDAVLVVSNIGHKTLEKEITIGEEEIKLTLTLETGGNELSEVIISAGVFEASDKKKGTVLKPLDIVTNPAASGDIYGALETLPGVTPVGNDTGLFVRGGEASETKTIIDGAMVASPFFSEVPDIPSRGRFNPFLFEGTLFSTGGYSAQYGQALSSVLILNTNDMPSNNEYSIGMNMAGLSASYTKTWKDKTAILASVGYTDLSTLFSIVPQNRTWEKPPNGISGSVGFRHKTAKGGLFKSFVQYRKGSIALNFDPGGNEAAESVFNNNNQNFFLNNSYSGFLGENWGVLAVASLSYDEDKEALATDKFGTKELLGQGRLTFTRRHGVFASRFGSEVQILRNDHYFNQSPSEIENEFTALYAESDISLTKKMVLRTGIRGEYSSVIDRFNFAPRLSISYRSGKNSLMSFAYGQFYQTPEEEYLRQTQNVDYEWAKHYILNYQWKKEQRIFRVETYYKDYDNLIKSNLDGILDNQGHGFSKGIDVFWRDQKTFPKLTYWLSYSFIDAERLYRDFPSAARPSFVSNHVLSVVGKYNMTSRWRLGMSYAFASGRPYFNPNNPEFLGDTTIDYHNINLSSSYLTTLFDNFTVIYLSLKNPFGIEQVFGYRYSEDSSSRNPITPSSDWSFFAGISISFRKK